MSVYMRIDKLDTIKGAATLTDVGGKKGLMAVDSFDWGAGRAIHVEVGSASHPDTGSIAFSDISIHRSVDGASPYLQTFFYQPGDNGRDVEILITKPDRKGDGEVPSMVITLEAARLTSYAISGSSASPSESLTLVYTSIAVVHYIEEGDGTIVKSDTVKYDLPTAKLSSAAKLP